MCLFLYVLGASTLKKCKRTSLEQQKAALAEETPEDSPPPPPPLVVDHERLAVRTCGLFLNLLWTQVTLAGSMQTKACHTLSGLGSEHDRNGGHAETKGCCSRHGWC